MPPKTKVKNRRPLAIRKARVFVAMAKALLHLGVTPDQISWAGLFFALLAGLCLVGAGHQSGPARVWLFVASAALIELRALCNMLDGMVAIEGGKQTPWGEVINDFPDRFSDLFMYVGAGYSITLGSWGPLLGWVAGTMAVLTAYIRVLTGALGLKQDFGGVMSKPIRMALLALTCLVAAFLAGQGGDGWTMALGLGVISLGSTITIAQRTCRTIRQLVK